MKKVFYSILGCAALLCGGTAVAALSGDDAAGSVIKRAAEDGDTPLCLWCDRPLGDI